ncbi:tyrosine-protein kinase family protein [Kibdelosporangium phytohabitans]|uniref:ATP/GTP-binding protein n=1 Tax=Kibdelosporangium phytohabitans TaxID=860235 RepID=A0A0N9HVI8_9PSEU|nr:AAA family ATPase [Kibdelosporangium phytohabitans]ALG06192.1 ATP/GTP-binding protein [Kibdelosporangium phytohabitans]MBE1465710.1 MinD-like ATPase involved in chromosome partitioning or flagellar assembly [Kibdelosporangium phytohabitans]
MTGTVLTFYSYKGGVGRSFTLANVAVLLARWGYRVLTVDWDLEAPGLHHYFAPVLAEDPAGGVVDLAHEFLAGAKTPPAHAVQVNVGDGRLALLAAGRVDSGQLDSSYSRRMQAINWEDLYQRGFADFLERCRAEWTDEYDFVLIDSRTGISDIASICTAQLPDRLVVVFTANGQNLKDVVDVARRADDARDRLPYDRPRHVVLPVLSRLDNRVEYERAEKWQHRCAEVVAPLFRNWLVKTVSTDLMLRHLTVPYVSYWSFGEQLPVLEEKVPSADQISFALETVAAVIAQQFDRTDVLADNRDVYVAAARSHRKEFELDLLVSSPRPSMRAATDLIDELRHLGLHVDRSLSADPEFLDQTDEPAKHLCLVVDGQLTRWQTTEAERFLRHAFGAEGDQRQLFCVLTRETDREDLPGFLRNLRHLELEPGMRPVSVARQLHDLIMATPVSETEPDHEALRTAAAALRDLPPDMPYAERFALVTQAVRGMEAALDDGDMDLLLNRSADLVLLSRAHGNGNRVATPPNLRDRVSTLLNRIDRRIKTSTD